MHVDRRCTLTILRGSVLTQRQALHNFPSSSRWQALWPQVTQRPPLRYSRHVLVTINPATYARMHAPPSYGMHPAAQPHPRNTASTPVNRVTRKRRTNAEWERRTSSRNTVTKKINHGFPWIKKKTKMFHKLFFLVPSGSAGIPSLSFSVLISSRYPVTAVMKHRHILPGYSSSTKIRSQTDPKPCSLPPLV